MKRQHPLTKQPQHSTCTFSVTDDGRRVTTSTTRLEHPHHLLSSIDHSPQRQAAPFSVTDNDQRAIQRVIGAKFSNGPQGAIFRGGYPLRARVCEADPQGAIFWRGPSNMKGQIMLLVAPRLPCVVSRLPTWALRLYRSTNNL